MDYNLFQNLSIWDPLHNFDHYMVLGCLRSAAHKENHRYLGNLRRPPPASPEYTNPEGRVFCGLALVHTQAAAQRATGELVDICGYMAPRCHKGGVAKRTSEIPAPHMQAGKEGTVDTKGGP